MIRKLLLFVRSLFLNFSNSSKERSFTPSLRMLCLGLFFIFFNSVSGQITQPTPWTKAYDQTTSAGTSANFPIAAGTNRILVVAVTTTFSESGGSGTQADPSTISYGGVTLTKATGDGGTSGRMHTWLYYLKDNAVMNATSKPLLVTVGGITGSTLANMTVWYGVYAGVNQTPTSYAVSNGFSNTGTNNATALLTSPGLSINSNEQAIYVSNIYNDSNATIPTYTINSNWTSGGINQGSNTSAGGTVSWKIQVANRGIPASNVTDQASTLTISPNGGVIRFAMSALSLPSIVPTITSLGSTGGCAGGTITINGTNLTGATAATVKIGGTAVSSIISNTGTVITATIGSGTTGTVTVTTPNGTATSTATFTVNPAPNVGLTVGGAATICSGSSTNITVASSENGASYQLRNGTTAIGSPVAGTGGTINLPTGSVTGTTTFNVYATLCTSSAQLTGTATVTINPAFSTQAGAIQTFCIDNSNTITTGTVNEGQYVVLNVVKGFNYTFSVGDRFTGNEILTVLDDATNTAVAPAASASGPSGASLTWPASISGAVKIVLSSSNCANGTSGGPLTLTLNSIGNIQDNQNLSGPVSDVWRGHVYNWTSGAPPGGTPSPPNIANTDPFASTQYVGYYDFNAETLNEGFGGNTNCFDVYSNGTVRTKIYTELFAVRYRMKSSKSGCYLVTIAGDDGVRLYLNGALIIDRWKEQSITTYPNVLVNLNGNDDFVLDYYENQTNNSVSFSIKPFDISSNTITPATSAICRGTSVTLDGSDYLINGSANPYLTFQWESSPDNSTWTNTGVTTEDYSVIPTTTMYYRRIVKAAAGSCSVTSASVVVNVSTPTLTAVSQPNSACTGSAATIRLTGLLPGKTFTVNYSIAGTAQPAKTGVVADASGVATFTTPVLTITNNNQVLLITSITTTSTTPNCSATFSGISTNLSVSPVTVVGTVSGDQTICSGTQPGNITLSGNVGTVTKWQKSTDATFSTGIVDIPVTATTLTGATIGALTTTTYFRAEVQSGGCTAVTSASVKITVNSAPTITLNKTDETCAASNNGTITPVISGGLANIKSIRLTQKYVNADAWQQVAEIQAFEIFTGTNVALASNGAVANSSSNYSNNAATYGPQRAIDGDINTIWHSNTTNINEFIKVDLASAKNLDYLRIYNRSDCCQERGQNMLLELLDASNNVVYSKTIDLFGNVTTAGHYIDINVLDVSWSDSGGTTLNRTGLDAGIYTLSYADGAGCSTSSQANIGTTNPDAAVTSVTGPSSICIGGTATTYSANGVVLGGGSGAWNSTTPSVATVDASGKVTGVSAGTTTISYTITSGCGGMKSAQIAITVNANASAGTVFAGTTPQCIGATTTYTVSGQVLGGGTGSWASDNGAVATVNGSTGVVTAVSAGTANIIYMVTGGCGTSAPITASKPYTVIANSAITSVTGPNSICIGGTATAYTANGVVLGSGTGAWSSSTPTVATVDASGNVTGVSVGTTNITYTISSGCNGNVFAQKSITVNPVPTVAAITGGATSVCVGGTTPAFANATPSGVWSIINGTGTATINSSTGVVTGVTAGNVDVVYTVTNGSSCSKSSTTPLTINPNYPAPIVGTPSRPSCAAGGASVSISGLPASGNLLQDDGTTVTTIAFTSSSITVSQLAPGTYKFGVNNGCTVTYSAPVNVVANTFTGGTSWSYGTPPTSDEYVNFASGTTISSDATYCSVTVSNGAVVTVASGITLTVTKGVHVVGTGSNLIFDDTSTLIQNNSSNTLNTGTIRYNRYAGKIRQADYVYWSSPVKNQVLGALSSATASDKYFAFDGTKWVFTPKTSLMTAGKGYIIRGPDTYSNTTKTDFTGTFIGTPQNGDFTGEAMVGGNFYLLGNPYPSALSADLFILETTNKTLLEGTLYFWTHNTPVVLVGAYQYQTDDYAVYNLSGGTGTRPAISGTKPGLDTPNNTRPNGKIGAGQAFFVGTVASGNVKFTNSMRLSGNNNGQFFKPGKAAKTAAIEKHRLWLNMTNDGGAFKQLLVAYVDGATNNYERLFDGKTFDGNKFLDFYSISDKENLAIQGRSLPFNDADQVPLGYRTTIAGDFTIAIDEVDGNMTTQAIYVEDKKTGVIHDLRESNYTFTTDIGTFEDRLVLRYTNKSLGTGDFENVDKGITVSVKDKTVKILSSNEVLKEVTIFDVAGKQIYNKKKVGTSELLISNLQSGNQVLLVDITLENGYKTTRKIIFQ